MEALGVRVAYATCVVLFGMMVEGSRESRARQRTLCCAALPLRVLAPAFRPHRYEEEAHDRPGLTSTRPADSHDWHLEAACPFGDQRCLLSPTHGSCPELQLCPKRHSDRRKIFRRCGVRFPSRHKRGQRPSNETSPSPAPPSHGIVPRAADGSAPRAAAALS